MKILEKKLLFLFLLLSLSQCQQHLKTTTYYLIRHAEKDLSDPSNRNPHLTKEGKARAERWATYFKDIPLDAIYSTDYERTQQTVAPIAYDKELAVLSYDPKNMDTKGFMEDTEGKTVLIVGHSNSTPTLVNSLIEEERYEQIDESIHENLYVVVIKGDKAGHELKKVD